MKEKNKKVAPSYNGGDIKSPQEMIDMCANEPQAKYLWRGIEDASLGYIFGPSKTGKTILCENLGCSLAVGRATFFGDNLIGSSQKVLMVGIEENYRKRTERMLKQMTALTEEEKKLFNKNMLYAGKDFPQSLDGEEYWTQFVNKVAVLKPNVIIIDSLTRMINGDITDRRVCQKILAQLRTFAYENGIAVVLVHHTRKNSGKAITMESMIGSSILSQEADFAIAVNRNELSGVRYVKDVFYRYEETEELIYTYHIEGDSCWLEPIEKMEEYKVLGEATITSTDNSQLIRNYLEDKAEEVKSGCDTCLDYTITTSELRTKFVETSTMKSRTFEYNLKKLVSNGVLIKEGKKGSYKFVIK